MTFIINNNNTNTNNNNNNKVRYLASPFVVDPVNTFLCKYFPQSLVWSPCKIWLLFLILCEAHIGGPKVWRTRGPALFGCGCGWPLKTCFVPSVSPCQIWSFYVKPYKCNYRDPPEKKIDLSRPAFRGYSRSLLLTRIDRLPMTSY